MAQRIVDDHLSGLIVGEGMPFQLGAHHAVHYRTGEVEQPEPGSSWNSVPKFVLSAAAVVALIAAFWPESLTDKPKTEARASGAIGSSALAK